MAVVIPFGDAQAHGSIAKSITFRRHRGKVVLQKKPHAKVPGTPKQKTQRGKFKDAWKAFHKLDFWALEYLKYKAIEHQTTAALFFLSQYLLTEVPSTTPQFGIKDITDLDLPDLIAVEDMGLRFSFLARTDPDTDVNLGYIWDKENHFYDGVVADPYNRMVICIHRVLPEPINIPFDYPLLIWWDNFSDVQKHHLIRFPSITLALTASDTPWVGLAEITKIEIYPPAITGGENVTVDVIAEHGDPLVEMPYYDDDIRCNIGDKTIFDPSINYPVTYIKIKFVSNHSGTFQVPNNWVLTIKGYEKDQPYSEWNIIFPAFNLEFEESIEFWISDDLSLWYDREMTNLAKGPPSENVYLYLAQDFSLYYDKEMTQLANSPYF
jgi:hypothetical protein